MKKSVKRAALLTVISALVLPWTGGRAHAACSGGPDVFTCLSEADYLAKASELGYATFQEGFEDATVWGSVRSPSTAPSVTSQGVSWTANHAQNAITSGAGASNTGRWGIYDPEHGFATGTPAQCDIDSPPVNCLWYDGVTGTRVSGEGPFFAVGGYVRTSTLGSDIAIVLDDLDQIDLGKLPDPLFHFLGVIDARGFTSFQVRETEGKIGQKLLIFMDDFTIGIGPATDNSAPVANAGSDQTAVVGDTVTLDGSASSDVDGDTLTYLWSLTTVPAGSAANLSDATAMMPTFDIDVFGDYVAQLVVSDGTLESAPATVTISTLNQAPTADAGPDQSIAVGATATLDGNASGDPDGDALSYRWALTGPTGSAAVLSDATAQMPTFFADMAGTYQATLTVNDGRVDSTPATVNISTLNRTPTAYASPDQSIAVGATATLDGSGSTDPDGDPLSYRWALSAPAGSTARLSDPAAVNPTFGVDLPGTYSAQLIVNDGAVDSAPDTVLIITENSAPVADAGADQIAFVGDTLTLDASASSDVDGDPLSYQWTLTVPAGSTAVLSDPAAVNPTFGVDLPGDYSAQLIVNDGTVSSAPDRVLISTDNSAPVADAGADQTAFVGDTVTLDASASNDFDGDPLSYQWTLSAPAGSTASLSDPTAVNPAFGVDLPGSYSAQLIVNDGAVDSAPDRVLIGTENSAPVSDAGADQTAFVGDTIRLDASASNDVDGDPLAYQWTLTVPAGSTAVLSDPAAVNPTFGVDLPGNYSAQLIVSDGTLDSASDRVLIGTENSAPVADAGADQTAFVADRVILDASGSNDVDGDALTYQWSLTTVPAGSAATLADPTAVMPSFYVDLFGQYVAQLVVNDGSVDSTPATVVISTDNSAPVANVGSDQTAFVGGTVTLDGSASSDVDGDALTYLWSLTTVPAGSAATLSDPAAMIPIFDIDLFGDYVAQLVVNDGRVDSVPATLVISTENSAPVANAGADQTGVVGDTVTLDGSASIDADTGALTYQWSLIAAPAGSLATLSDPTAVMPSFDVDLLGQYVAQLVVNDGSVDSAPATVLISAENSAPVANAGVDQTAIVGDTVTLDGSASSDVDGDTLTYLWSLTTVPAGSAATLSDATATMPTFVIDVFGDYVAQLVVSDGALDSAPATVTISTLNQAPTADAGPDQSIAVGATVTLDGNASSDPDGDTLSYRWTLTGPTGSAAVLSDATAQMPTFFANMAGTYQATLTVNDGRVDSTPATVNISTLNQAPTADAGPDQSIAVGASVTLDGNASSDPDGDTLSYRWTLTGPTGSTAALSDETAQMPTFVADAAGTYQATLTVSDGLLDSLPATVTVNISTLDRTPNADAGPDQSIAVGATATLDGSASSDPESDPLSYQWTLSAPAGSTAALSDATTQMPTFFADVAGTYQATLTVNDGRVDSTPATVNISTLNRTPTAAASPDQSIAVGATATLDGSGSSDPDGDPLSYRWTLSAPAGSTASLSDPAAVNPTFGVDLPGTYSVQLIVNDGAVDSAPDAVLISTENSTPVADAGADQTAFVTDTVILDASGSNDVDGDALTYQWSLTTVPAGSVATLSDPTAILPMFDIDVFGDYVAQLVVNDGSVDSVPATLVISTENSAPVADAGADQTAFVGGTVTLDGSASSDVDGDALTYLWSLTTVPAGSVATLSDPTAILPTFDIDVFGDYVAQLVVNDGSVDSVPVTVLISTENSAPVANAGSDQTAFVGDTVTLDGGASSDADSGALTYQWSLIAAPAGSLATLSDPTAVMPSFDVDLSGQYVAQLVVNDGSVDSAPATVLISAENSAPVANAGADQTAIVGDIVTLDGSASSDVDGDALTYRWSLTSVPAGSEAILFDETTSMPTLEMDVFGAYVAQLIVNDGSVDSLPDTVVVEAPEAGQPPEAPKELFVGPWLRYLGVMWTDSDSATLYSVYRRLNTEASFRVIGQTKDAVFVDALPRTAAAASYYVTAENSFGVSSPSPIFTTEVRHWRRHERTKRSKTNDDEWGSRR